MSQRTQSLVGGVGRQRFDGPDDDIAPTPLESRGTAGHLDAPRWAYCSPGASTAIEGAVVKPADVIGRRPHVGFEHFEDPKAIFT